MGVFVAVSNAFTLNDIKSKISHLTTAVTLGEQLISAKDDVQCLEKALCMMQTLAKDDLQDDAFKPVQNFISMATNNNDQIESATFAKIQGLLKNYPRISSLVNSLSTGKKFNDEQVCTKMYDTCPLSKESLITVIKNFGNLAKAGSSSTLMNSAASELETMMDTPKRVRRCDPKVACGTGGAVCGAAAVGCGVCEFLSAGLCTGACAVGVTSACGAVSAGCGVASAAC